MKGKSAHPEKGDKKEGRERERERERGLIYSLRARLENVYPRGCRGAKAARMPLQPAYREMDLIALIIFNGRRYGEKVHVENVERSTESRGDFARIAINCTASGSLASIVYRIATEPLLNPIRRNLRSFSAYVLYYVSKGKEFPYQISPGVRWMYGRVDITNISARSSVAYGATYLLLSVIDWGRNWVELGRNVFLVRIQN